MKHRAILLLLVSAAVQFSTLAGTPARRLNRYEYNASVRDLLRVDFHADNDFPADNFSYGFDNNADTLTTTPALLKKYLDAARKIAREAVEPMPAPASPELERRDNSSTAPDLVWQRNFIWEGDYDFHIALAGPNHHTELKFALDHAEPQPLSISVNFEGRRYADTRLHVSAGPHRLRVLTSAQAGVYPEYMEARGPYGLVLPAVPAGDALVFSCGHTQECIRSNLGEIARHAWRRPVTSAEIDGLMRLASNGKSIDGQMETGIEAILVSPAFLFRIEDGSEFALASRLSYFLWSSLPDDELFRLALQNQLRDPEVLAKQARRMLSDAKSNALAENFAAQWLEFRNLDFLHRDPASFPEFTPELRDAMRQETERFVDHVIHQDCSVIDFLNGKYTFVNELLAKLYGIPGVTGDNFRRVDLTGTPRAGIVTQASVLTVTSYATRTSPVLRGKWILENLLNEPPPPPPANVPALRDPTPSDPDSSLRHQLEEHRANPACAGCHARMDDLGFALENFDAIGRWRPMNDGESAGAIPTRPDAFAQCLAEKLLTFALGRGLTSSDRASAAEAVKAAAAHQYRFSDLVTGLVTSPSFQHQHD